MAKYILPNSTKESIFYSFINNPYIWYKIELEICDHVMRQVIRPCTSTVYNCIERRCGIILR